MFSQRIRAVFLRPLVNCTRSFSTNDLKLDLLEAVNKCRQIRFKAFRVGAIPGHAFSQSGAHELVEYVCDSRGEFQNMLTLHKVKDKEKTMNDFTVGFRALFNNRLKAFEQFLLANENAFNESGLGLFYQSSGALLKYLENLDFHQNSLRDLQGVEKLTETRVASILAVHLILQLTVSHQPSYMLSNNYNFKYEICPCKNKDCQQELTYGDTYIGSPDLFYGKPDILVLPKGAGSCSIVVPKRFKKLKDVDEDGEMQMVEVNTSEELLRSPENEKQIASIAVTFSYFQRIRQHKRNLNFPSETVSIIPTIALCKDSFDIYMYDTNNDILLRNEGEPISLWQDEENISLSALVAFWIIINHLTFKPKITSSMKRLRGSGGLAEHIDPQRLDLIERSMRMASLKSMPFKRFQENKKKIKTIDLDYDSE